MILDKATEMATMCHFIESCVLLNSLMFDSFKLYKESLSLDEEYIKNTLGPIAAITFETFCINPLDLFKIESDFYEKQ